MTTKTNPETKEVVHDETPSIINDHPFEPKTKAQWWSLCGHRGEDGRLCNLAESAHKETTTPFRYIADDLPPEYD